MILFNILKKFAYYFVIIIPFVFLGFEAKSITISPGTLEIETEANTPKNATIKVINDTGKDQKLNVIIMDLIFDKNGKKKYLPISPKNKNTISRYIEPSIRETVIKANQIQDINLIFNIPENIVGGNSAIVFFRLSPFIPKGVESGVSTATALGTTILQESKGTAVVKSRISQVDIKRLDKNRPLNFEMNVLNQGNTFLKTTGTVLILGDDDSFKGTFNLSKQVIPPKKAFVFKEDFKVQLEEGAYTAVITYQYKDKSINIIKPFKI